MQRVGPIQLANCCSFVAVNAANGIDDKQIAIDKSIVTKCFVWNFKAVNLRVSIDASDRSQCM